MDPILQHLKSVVENAPGLIPWERWLRENRAALEALLPRTQYLHLKFKPMEEIPRILGARGIDCIPAVDSDCFHGCPECGSELKTSWAGDMWFACPKGCVEGEFHYGPRREVVDEGLREREAAVTRVREAGLHADVRGGPSGMTICCYSSVPREGRETAGRPPCVIHLIPIGEDWGIDLVGCLPRTRYEQRWSLEEATGIAIRILKSKFIPVSDKEIEITHARVEGGESISITHTPTGIRRQLKGPGQKKGVTQEEKERAFREIVLELSWLE